MVSEYTVPVLVLLLIENPFHYHPDLHELLQVWRLAEICGSPQPGGLGAIGRRIGRSQDDHWHVAAPGTLSHTPQNLMPGSLGKIEVEKHQGGAWHGCIRVSSLDPFEGLLAIVYNLQVELLQVLSQRFANNIDIGRAIFDQKDDRSFGCN
jgi:hypothetical protein